MTVAALIVAAGRGTRMGSPTPKAFLPLGGVPILARAVAAFSAHPRIGLVVAVVSDLDAARRALGEAAARVVLVAGGPERQDSVRLGLAAVGGASLVLVHDAARPLVPRRVVDAVLEAAARYGAAVPALPVRDTIKRRAPGGGIAGTVPRDDLALAQTPQGFRTGLLREAYARADREGFLGTDDAILLERAGVAVALVPGSPRNIKITTPADLRLAEAILALGPGEEGGQDE